MFNGLSFVIYLKLYFIHMNKFSLNKSCIQIIFSESTFH